jgi:NAD+ diphosphatase
VARSREGFLLDDNGPLFPREWLKRQDLSVMAEHGIGHLDGEPVYLLELNSPGDVPGCRWQGLRAFMLGRSPSVQSPGLCRANRYLGPRAPLLRQLRPGDGAGARRARNVLCQACDLRSYPRISPSMIVLITRGDEILLARSPRFVTGVYSTLAGFAEPGESAEDCLIREVHEEVQVRGAEHPVRGQPVLAVPALHDAGLSRRVCRGRNRAPGRRD